MVHGLADNSAPVVDKPQPETMDTFRNWKKRIYESPIEKKLDPSTGLKEQRSDESPPLTARKCLGIATGCR